jgi:hypothetical protein
MQLHIPANIARGSKRNRRVYLYGALSCKTPDEKRISVWIAHLIELCAPWAYGKSEKNRLKKYRAAMAKVKWLSITDKDPDPADWWKQ